MTDAEILKLLATLGIDDLSYKALSLLPLVHVAWADGEIQAEERALVEKTMTGANLGAEGERLVRNWLTYAPSADYVERGRTALVALALRGGEMKLEADVLTDVVGMAQSVARAAGGLWGIGAINKDERKALDEIAAALNVSEGTAWRDAVQEQLDDEPTRQRVLIRFDTDTLDLGAMPGVLTPINQRDTQIPVDGTVLLGRGPECTVHVEGGGVSDEHCRVWAESLRFYVRDLDSDGGTWVDGERIVERRLLGGEVIRLGSAAALRFQLLRRVPKQML